jgi:hypothetical protein
LGLAGSAPPNDTNLMLREFVVDRDLNAEPDESTK